MNARKPSNIKSTATNTTAATVVAAQGDAPATSGGGDGKAVKKVTVPTTSYQLEYPVNKADYQFQSDSTFSSYSSSSSLALHQFQQLAHADITEEQEGRELNPPTSESSNSLPNAAGAGAAAFSNHKSQLSD
nr:hypothetical transcript [Hymenolepis microstoma]